jgi:cytochrome c biogenesis protein CcdA
MTKTKHIFLLIFAISFIFIPFISYGQAHAFKERKLTIFSSPGCHNCIHIEKEIMPAIETEFKDSLRIEYRNVDDIENYKLLLSLKEEYQSKIRDILPVFYFEGRFINGKGDVKKNLEKLLAGPAAGVKPIVEILPRIDLIKRFNNFTLPAIIAVGLIDGINPCAVTVIVFFISFLTFQGYRKREIAVIGLVFILSVYLTYVLIGLGIFEFLYKLQGFWLLTKTLNIIVGIISIIFSTYALYDFIKYRKTKSTDDLLLSLPQSIKNQIHRVIGSCYRIRTGANNPVIRKPLIRLAISALATGFLVSILEAVCVAKIYLPTIVFVLKTTNLKLKALSYLLLYNLLFVVPLLIIFCFALTGTTAERFQKILKGHLGLVKILMGVMFLGMGVFLIWRA